MKMVGVAIVLPVVGLIGGYAAVTLTRSTAPSRIMILTNYEAQQLENYPLTLDQAKAEGYVDVSGAVFRGWDITMQSSALTGK